MRISVVIMGSTSRYTMDAIGFRHHSEIVQHKSDDNSSVDVDDRF